MLALAIAVLLGAGPGAGSAVAEAAPVAVQIPSDIPVRRDRDPRAPGPAGTAPALLSVALAILAGGALWGLRRARGGGRRTRGRGSWTRWLGQEDEGVLRLVQSRQLTARASVHVLRWGGREWLLGCGDQQVTLLGEQPMATASPGPAESSPDAGRSP